MAEFSHTIRHLCRHGIDLTVRQIHMVNLLHEAAEQPDHRLTKNLAADMNVQKPVVTRCADRLEADGYLTRATPATDRRLCRMTLTAAGTRLALQLRDGFQEAAGKRKAA